MIAVVHIDYMYKRQRELLQYSLIIFICRLSIIVGSLVGCWSSPAHSSTDLFFHYQICLIPWPAVLPFRQVVIDSREDRQHGGVDHQPLNDKRKITSLQWDQTLYMTSMLRATPTHEDQPSLVTVSINADAIAWGHKQPSQSMHHTCEEISVHY